MSKNKSLDVARMKSEVIDQLPAACGDERLAVEFFEAKRWPDGVPCLRCGSVDVYAMRDSKTGQRQVNYRWRCRDCKYQFTVKTGAIFEDSPIPMRKWALAFWMFTAGKKGCAALELMRALQVTYETAWYMAQRIRFAMEDTSGEPLTGIVEVDECYVGGKPRPLSKGEKEAYAAAGEPLPKNRRGRGTRKIPVVAVVQREGKVRRRAIANITAHNMEAYLKGTVHGDAAIMTDELNIYPSATRSFKGGHYTTKHREDEYARTDEETGLRVHSNTAESSHALLKRGIVGVYHRISPKHLHRYLAAADWAWNTRGMSDGDRVLDLIRGADGKRLFYRAPRDPRRLTARPR